MQNPPSSGRASLPPQCTLGTFSKKGRANNDVKKRTLQGELGKENFARNSTDSLSFSKNTTGLGNLWKQLSLISAEALRDVKRTPGHQAFVSIRLDFHQLEGCLYEGQNATWQEEEAYAKASFNGEKVVLKRFEASDPSLFTVFHSNVGLPPIFTNEPLRNQITLVLSQQQFPILISCRVRFVSQNIPK